MRTMISPNKSKRNLDYWSLIVIHHISLPYIAPMSDVILMNEKEETEYFEEICKFLCNKKTKASSHFCISRHGKVVMLVNCDLYRAWHCGVSLACDPYDGEFKPHVNNFSIGIELIGDGNKFEFTDAQYNQCDFIIRWLMEKYNIKATSIVGHDAIGHKYIRQPAKIDPGKLFDWQRLLSTIYNNLGYKKTWL